MKGVRAERWISSSGVDAVAACAGAALIYAGAVNAGLASMPKSAFPWGEPVTLHRSDWVAVPILEELCARLAAFGLVGPMGMEPRSAPVRECRPVLVRLGASNEPEPTSIFTTVRAGPGRIAGSLSIRFKLNALEPRTQDQAVALLGRAVRSILRGYDLEMPDSLAVALEKLEDGSHTIGPILMEIATEHEDTRRHNIFLSIQTFEKHGTNFGKPDLMPNSSTNGTGQVSGGF